MTLPTLFLSHGSPLHARGGSRAATGWAALADRLPRPAAVLMVSAHWETGMPMVGGSAQPETIHDFGGFPPDLYQIRYPAPGAPARATRIAALLRDAGLGASVNGCRGLDHGAWVPLQQMYPQADVPVLQLSVQPALDARHHLRLGAALAPLADEGVLVVGSGHLTHNLQELMQLLRRGEASFGDETAPAQHVAAFRDWVDAVLREPGTASLADWLQRAPQATRLHPTPEHFLPLLVARAAAGAAPDVERIDLGVEARVLAMDAYVFSPAAVR
jgi:4,5-DOPA dioxygenase extradiol